jgi:acetolactate synthase-1/2/3 large subunit
MLKNGKKTGLVLGNLALHGEALNIAGSIGAKTGAALLSEIFPSYHLSRGEGRPPVDPIPYEFEVCLKFLQPFEQLIFVGALFPVATFAYKNKPTMKSPPGCDLFVMASVEQDLTAALRSLAEASGAVDAAASRQPRTEAAAPIGELTAEAIGQSLCMLMPDNAILVDEAATNGTPIFAATKGARAHDYLAPVNGGPSGVVCPWLSARRSPAPTGRSFIFRRTAAACTPSRRCGRWRERRPTSSLSFSRMTLTRFSASRWHGFANRSSTPG